MIFLLSTIYIRYSYDIFIKYKYIYDIVMIFLLSIIYIRYSYDIFIKYNIYAYLYNICVI